MFCLFLRLVRYAFPFAPSRACIHPLLLRYHLLAALFYLFPLAGELPTELRHEVSPGGDRRILGWVGGAITSS